jgi:hypothetical protein
MAISIQKMMIQRHGVLGCPCQTNPRINRPPLYQKKIFPISGNQGFVNARHDEFGACLSMGSKHGLTD